MDIFQLKALAWAQQFETLCYLDANHYPQHSWQFDWVLAAGASRLLAIQAGSAFERLKEFRASYPGWLFGYFAYDLKNEVERLNSQHTDHIGLLDLLFFQPECLLVCSKGKVEVLAGDEKLLAEIEQHEVPLLETAKITIKTRFNKEEYLKAVKSLQNHIVEGDIYEANLCQEFYAQQVSIQPLAVFNLLNDKNKAPFSGFFKHQERYVLCSSPERFLAKKGQQLLSQPIKGTIRKGKDPVENESLKQQLYHDIKERAENVMIVDLVRNDLAKSCLPGTVHVDELFGIYSFEQVHHMISTISGTLRPDCDPIDAIKNTFPMGSMTGAPKISAMRLIESHELSKRGVYSGALGYFSPEGDFDFNVVIRSILYNAASKYLSFQAGGAITYDANPEKEYEECLLKAKAMMEVLGGVKEQ
ncbi:MAG: anthranilate synthase component I family protein [Chitinophagales bacterium]|nr:anthranilate synthase component I family protein [Chitinophagales bacterium]